MTPRPPCCAMAIARRDSVTVSMAAETSGMFRPISSRQAACCRSTSRGMDLGVRAGRAGRRRTSGRAGISASDEDAASASRRLVSSRAVAIRPPPRPAPWHFLYFLPEPHGHGSLRPTFGASRWTVSTLASWPPDAGGAVRSSSTLAGARRDGHRRRAPRRCSRAAGRRRASLVAPRANGLEPTEVLDDLVLDPLLHRLKSSKLSFLYSMSGSRWP